MNIYREILLKYWGYPKFRPLQEDIIKSVAAGNDTLGLMPTGGGKSITFQVPALSKDGVCIVVTPLIALMKDQVENLKEKGIKAVSIYSGMSRHEIDTALDNCIYGKYKFLYVSPERLSTEIFITRIQSMNVNLLAIDESHCISQWGYDFRPSYLNIVDIRKYIPKVPILALTATATPEVVKDIQEKLEFGKENLFKKSFERKNLTYIVRDIDDKRNYLLKRLNKIKGSGIIYVRNRKGAKDFSDFLRKNGISSDYYHAGLDTKTRDKKQDNWKSNKSRIMVSTNAFGMGIDKPDVRFVAHIDLPDSLEAYFQEAGRAGRDEKKSFAVLLYNQEDITKLNDNFLKSFPDKKIIKQVYNALCNFYQIPLGGGKNQVFDFNIINFSKSYQFDVFNAYSSLKFLEKEGYIELTNIMDNPARAHMVIPRDELYDFQLKNPEFDKIIKLLLRSYTGLFSEYIKINTSLLSKSVNISQKKLETYLQKLDKLNIIKYIPQNKSSLIIFNEERLDKNSLKISKENYIDRKRILKKKVESVISYVESTTKCRSQMLLNYFGQKNANRCGFCDICQTRNELDLSKYEFDHILEDIKEKLIGNPILLTNLIDTIDKKEDKVIKVIQWLLDNNKMSYNKDNKLEWSSNK